MQYNKSAFFCRAAALFVVIVLAAACARKIRFETSRVVPAAQGTVKVKRDNNSNYSIKIDIRHLADPTRLRPPRSVYVVWIETSGRGAKNLGRLKTFSGLFSNTLSASMEAVSPFKPTRIFITAEDRANIEYPGSYVVLNTTSF